MILNKFTFRRIHPHLMSFMQWNVPVCNKVQRNANELNYLSVMFLLLSLFSLLKVSDSQTLSSTHWLLSDVLKLGVWRMAVVWLPWWHLCCYGDCYFPLLLPLPCLPSNTYMYAIFFMLNLILENKNDQW